MCWLPLLPFFICLLFLTKLRQGAGEGMTPRSRGQPAVWSVGRDVKMEAWGCHETSPPEHLPHAVRCFAGYSSALSGCLNCRQHLHPVLAFTLACGNFTRKLGSKTESPWSLKGLRLGVLEKAKWKIEIQLWIPECPNSGKYLDVAIFFQLK